MCEYCGMVERNISVAYLNARTYEPARLLPAVLLSQTNAKKALIMSIRDLCLFPFAPHTEEFRIVFLLIRFVFATKEISRFGICRVAHSIIILAHANFCISVDLTSTLLLVCKSRRIFATYLCTLCRERSTRSINSNWRVFKRCLR